MEILTIVVAGLLGAISPIGIVVDTVAINNLKQRIESAEVVAVRIDNAPSYQIIQGKVNKVRIATRNLELIPELIIDTLELETDPINLSLNTLQQGGENSFNRALREPLQGAVRLVITEENLNRALKSPTIDNFLQQVVNQGFDTTNYKLLNTKVNLLDNNRIAASATIDRGSESTPLDIMLELGIIVVEGRKIELVDIELRLGQTRLPGRILTRSINEGLDLARLEEGGITARVLNLDIEGERIDLAAFIAIEGETAVQQTEILREK